MQKIKIACTSGLTLPLNEISIFFRMTTVNFWRVVNQNVNRGSPSPAYAVGALHR